MPGYVGKTALFLGLLTTLFAANHFLQYDITKNNIKDREKASRIPYVTIINISDALNYAREKSSSIDNPIERLFLSGTKSAADEYLDKCKEDEESSIRRRNALGFQGSGAMF